MIPSELKAEKGDKILPKFKKLVSWIESQRLVSVDDRVTISTTPNGTHVSMVDRPPSIVTPLQLRLNGKGFFSITEGYINGKLPKIGNQDIVNPDGISAPPTKLPVVRPILVCASVKFDNNYKLITSEIVCKEPKEIPRAGSANYLIDDKSITGLIPLAFLRRDIFIQFVTHNLQVRAYTHNGSYRIIYWPT
jgi:hypothetical protein